MSKYTRFQCDRCGSSSETEDGSIPTREYRSCHLGESPAILVDLCPECWDDMMTIREDYRTSWQKIMSEWYETGRAVRGK